jgi:hypothetical protein
VTFWEARRIIRGYRKRDRFTQQLLAEIFEAAKYANPYRKHDGKSVRDLFPQIFEYDEEETMLTADDISELQADMDAWNNQAKSD